MSATECVIYTRVSTEEQEREGYSIDAQLTLLREYALRKRLQVMEEFVDSETARSTGRTGFNRMRKYLIDNPESGIILVEKTDRLSRNQRDYLDLDVEHTGLEIHFVREGRIFSRESSPTEFFNVDIQLAQAAFVSRNISAEAKKGMRAKAEMGLWPSYAPIGYINADAAQARIIVPDPVRAPLIRKLYERYATGTVSIAKLVQYAQAMGLTSRSNHRLSTSTVHRMLTNPIYMGDFIWRGQQYTGQHEPIVNADLWHRVQDTLAGRKRQKTRHKRRKFAFSGLIQCGTCGCSIVGERKKEKYNYYHCTEYRKKHPEPWMKEAELDRHFSDLLGKLTVDQKVIEWIVDTLRDETEEAFQAHQGAIERFKVQKDRLRSRLNVAYDDRLDGRIDTSTYDTKAEEINSEIARLDRAINELGTTPDTDLPTTARETLELAQEAHNMFVTAPSSEKCELLRELLSNCILTKGELDTKLTHVYAMIADTNAVWMEKKAAGAENLDIRSTWYPVRD